MADYSQSCGACQLVQPIFPFTMAFQPIVDILEQRIISHEALVRGPSGESAMSMLSQVTPENRYAFDQACRVKAIDLAARLRLDCDLNINFLPNAIYEPKACIRATLDAAKHNQFPLDRLIFEFTENEEVADTQHIRNIIEEYRRHGFKIALDDFGIGYSHLARLIAIKPDLIKIDRELVKDCDQDMMRQAVLASMISLGKETGIRIVAEGVERIEEVETLHALGCRYIQGFYFAKPIFEGLARNADIVWPDCSSAAAA